MCVACKILFGRGEASIALQGTGHGVAAEHITGSLWLDQSAGCTSDEWEKRLTDEVSMIALF